MVKNYFLSFALLVVTSGASFSQCTPDPLYQDSTFGVWPDTTENLPCAFGNEPSYNAVINIKTLTDTTVTFSLGGAPTTITAYIEAFRVNSVNGLPEGFTYIPNATVWTNGGSAPNYTSVQGCLQIVASQASIQGILATNPNGIDFDLTVIVDAKINSTDNSFANVFLAGKWLSEVQGIPGVQAIPVEGYKIKVRPVSGNCAPLSTNDIEGVSFNATGNFPNPFVKSTEIRFTASRNQEVSLQVYNMVGKEVKREVIKANRGSNSFTLSSEELKSGIYFYTLNDGKKTFTRKMIVSAN